MDIKKFCQISIFLIFTYFALPSFAQQYLMPVGLPACEDTKTIANELPELPTTDYPAKHYNNAKLIERILALANDPFITPKDLQVEYGLKFFECISYHPHAVDPPQHRFLSKGQFPLGGVTSNSLLNRDSRSWRRSLIDVIYIKYTTGGHYISINFNQNKNGIQGASLIDCIYRNEITELLDKKWIPKEYSAPYMLIHEKKEAYFNYSLIMTDSNIKLPFCKKKGGVDYFSVSFLPNY